MHLSTPPPCDTFSLIINNIVNIILPRLHRIVNKCISHDPIWSLTSLIDASLIKKKKKKINFRTN